ncbi:tape measure protein [Lactobacillus sp. ESL0703]|uniref:tape measure protein n=1 Tax=Lactobacillus sp. ESL0703 TaxID=2983218 RepID=UPI0023F76955|nr:tape measure protein [Lactobacillus sp. ESL0703]MDF7668525.1 tape measure protein [Lactobacillus sp. ESL0703]
MGVIETTIRLNDAFSGTLRKLESGLNAGSSGFDKLKGALNGGNMFGNATKQSNGFFKSMVGGTVVGGMISKGIGVITDNLDGAIDRLDTINNASRSFQNMGFSTKNTKSAISSLDQAVNGLPTPIDSALRNTQLLAASTGKLDKSTQIFKAMNDGILGFGGTSAMVNNAVLQLSQSLANGKVDGMTWNSMLNSNMGPVLEAIAKKMKITTGELKEGLSKGKISVDQFEDSLISLDKKGGGGLKSLTKIAADSTKGIKTSLANLHTGIKNALATGILKPLVDAGFTDTLNDLTTKIKASGPQIANAFSQIIDKVKSISRNIFEGFKSTGALSAVSGMFHDISATIGSIMAKASSGGGNNFFTQLGSFAGGVVSGAANAIDGIARAIGGMNPATLQDLASAFIILKYGMKGLVFTVVVNGLRNISRLDSGQIKQIATAIQILAGALVALKAVKGIANGILSINSAISSLSGIMEAIGSALSAGLGVALGTIAAVLAAITVVIGVAVWAWKNNFLGFRSFVSNIFSNLAAIFEPFRQAIGNLGNALAPVGQLLSVIGMVIAGSIVGSLYLLAGAVAVVVDLFSMLIDIVSIVIFSFRILVDAINVVLQALRDLFTLNWSFSNARNAINQVKSDVSGLKDTFSNLGNIGKNGATAGFINALSNIDSKAKTTQSDLNGIKVPNIAQNNASVFNMNNVAANKAALNKKVKVGYTFDTNPAGLKNTQNQITGQSVKTKVTPDMSKIGNLQQQVQSKMNNKPIKVKIATPKVPTPKAPKMKTIKAKVAKPKIPTPKAPKIKTLHVKVARPVIPQPRMPKLRNIPAPHVGRPSMVGVVSAAADALVAQADRAARAKAKIHSPSRLFAEVGSFIGQGMALGMNKTTGLVSAAGAGLIDAANTGGTVGVNYAGSGSITPASLTRSQVFSTRNNSSNSSHAVTIAKGAIVINGSSKPQQTADEIMTAIEKRMVEIDNRRL